MSYSRVATHAAMVFDGLRNAAYGQAISKLVKPGAIVLDLGAGLGIHGLLAAAAGASRVYLVEPEPVVHQAAAAARGSALSHRVVIVPERIEDAVLDEPVDMIVSVLTGNLLFSEDLLPSLFYARDRHLKESGALVPDRAQLWLAPLEASELHEEHVARWSRPVMGFDYSAARPFLANRILWPRSDQFLHTRRLAMGAAVVDLDLRTARSADCRGEASCVVESAGLCHGLLAWIRLRLCEDNWISTDPDSPRMHWSAAMLPIDPPLPVQAGDELKLSLQRPAYGDWTWSVSGAAGSRRHSTFLAKSESSRELARASPEASPRLSKRGLAALAALRLLDEGLSIRQVAARLVAGQDMSQPDALRLVQSLAAQYGRGPA